MNILLEKWVSWQEYRESVYVFHEALKKVYIFSGSALDFWSAMLSCSDREEITDQLCRKYGEEFRNAISADLGMFLDELMNYGLIQEVR